MWVKFPKGSNSVTVQQQPFVAEAVDAAGNSFTRVPDNFVAMLVSMGFMVETPPETDLADLPSVNPDMKKALEDLAAENDGLRRERQQLLDDSQRIAAAASAAGRERDLLHEEKAELQQKYDGLLSDMGKTDVGALQAELAAVTQKYNVAQQNLDGIHTTLAARGIDLSAPPTTKGK